MHAEDLADAALAALISTKTHHKTYNLSGGETLTYRNMAERLFAAMGKKPRIFPLPFLPLVLDVYGSLRHKSHINGEMARRMNEDLVFSHEMAAHDFGYAPRPFLPEGV